MLESTSIFAQTKQIPTPPIRDDLSYGYEVRTKSRSRSPTQDDLPCSDGVPMETARHAADQRVIFWVRKS